MNFDSISIPQKKFHFSIKRNSKSKKMKYYWSVLIFKLDLRLNYIKKNANIRKNTYRQDNNT